MRFAAHSITTNSEVVRATAPRPTVSSRYTFIPTSSLVTALQTTGWEFDSGTARNCRKAENRPFAHHVLRFSNNRLPALPDGTRPQAVILNSHGGGGAFELSFGAFRLACANGLVIQSLHAGSVRLRHVGLTTDIVVETCESLLREAPEVFGRVAEWSTIELPASKQEELASRLAHVRWNGNVKASVPSLLTARRADDVGSDLWRVFNRIQEGIVRGGVELEVTHGDGGVTRKCGSALRSPVRLLTINRELWQAAEEVAFSS
jgi:hypothetical protein